MTDALGRFAAFSRFGGARHAPSSQVIVGDPSYDAFERAALGSNWTIRNGDVVIVNDEDLGVASNTGGPFAGLGVPCWTAVAFNADQFCECIVAATKPADMYLEPFVRRENVTFGRYGFLWNPNAGAGRLELKYDGVLSGTYDLSRVAYPTQWAVGDTIRIEVHGTALRGLINGVQKICGSDATLVAAEEQGVAMNINLGTPSFPVPFVASWRGGSKTSDGGWYFANDTFTEASSDTAIASHTGERGATWTLHPAASFASGAALCMTANGRLRSNANSPGAWYMSGAPGSADYSVWSNFYVASNVGTCGILGRCDTTDATYYQLQYNQGVARWQMLRVLAGASTTLGFSAQTLTVGTKYTVELRMLGTSIKGLVDGVELFSFTDANITAAGRVGVFFNQTSNGAAIGYQPEFILATAA